MEISKGDNNKELIEKINKELHQEEALKEGKFNAVSILGKGTFGIVYKAKKEDSNDIFAVKRVFQNKRAINRELEILKELNHPNIIKLRYFFYTKDEEKTDEIYLNCVTDYFDKSLSHILNDNFKEKKQIEPFLIKLYSYQMFLALRYIHSLSITHRDIKPQNILVDQKTNKIILCDFGSAKKLIKGQESLHYICSRYYRAPELIFGLKDYDNKIDIWSIGCVLAELILGYPIFPGSNQSDQLVEIIRILGTPSKEDIISMNPAFQNQKFPQIKPTPFEKVFKNKEIPEHFLDLLKNLLVYNPQIRLDAENALKHKYFDEIRNIKHKMNKYNQYVIPDDLEII